MLSRYSYGSICVIAPVHDINDVRVVKKQVASFELDFEKVTIFTRRGKYKIPNCARYHLEDVPNLNSRILRFLYILWLTYKVGKVNADLYYCHNPDTIFIALVLKALGRQVIYDTHENFKKRILMREWIPRLLRPILAELVYRAEYLCYLCLDAFIVTQKSLQKEFGENCVLIENPPIKSTNIVSPIMPSSPELRFFLVYIGGLEYLRGVVDIINVLPSLNEHCDVRFNLAGRGSSVFVESLKELEGWQYVDFKGELEQESALELVGESHIGLAVLHDVGDYKDTSPNKLFEYSASGVPFIASNFSNWMRKYDEYEAGVFVEPRNPDALKAAFFKIVGDPSLYHRYSSNGLSFINETFSWDLEYEKLRDIFRRILRGS